MNIPVFLFTGFLESGKTTFILDTLRDPEFISKGKTLVIHCEDGEVEYPIKELKSKHISLVSVENEEELTEELLEKLNRKYQPKQVIIEHNGMWDVNRFLALTLPKSWAIAQILTTIDASTFSMYVNNMRSLLMQQVAHSDLIVINRCKQDTDQLVFRRNIKAINRKAQLIYETVDGIIMEHQKEILPYNINSSEITILDEDFGIFYLDITEHPEKYQGKIVKFRGTVYKERDVSKNTFVAGRLAMTCCADDISYIGLVCRYTMAESLNSQDSVYISARVNIGVSSLYKGEGPILRVLSADEAQKPEDDIVYFN
ncbi:MAG: GTP-binding protein [Clostridiaceae bacterium]